jgi:hypothetical protein
MCTDVPIAFVTSAAVVVLKPVGRVCAESRHHIELGVKYLLNKGRKGGIVNRVCQSAHRVVWYKDDLVLDSLDYSPLLRKGVQVERFNHRLGREGHLTKASTVPEDLADDRSPGKD